MIKENMNLLDIVNRTPIPAPWAEGEKIPWNEPGFSSRMLQWHFCQDHDAASRRSEIIDRQVEWIHGKLLGGLPGRVLDLGCGPGLYTSRLARRGCACTGIDFSPASIAYAIEQARQERLDCQYKEGDVRTTPFGRGYDLAMFIYGELNVFHLEEARSIVRNAYQALNPEGWLVLEPHNFEAVKAMGQAPEQWYTATSGLFSAEPHLYLEEHFWDEPTCTFTTRYWIIEARDGSVQRYASTMQAYMNEQYQSLLEEAGFTEVEFHPSLEGVENPDTRSLLAITARK